ncbi:MULTISPECIES: YueI family protein [Gracilibacillus]|uniref:YueI family protein n=1 Tax=Gracilibacillus TaxID=74385 RepID=UPI000824A36F|nr:MULTISPECIES: YueI family protein [Gracilibacillus]
MGKKEMDDYLQEGIYGAKELHPDQKKKYLGTYRERVILALTKTQVRGKKGLTTFEEELQKHTQATLLVNGHMNISFSKPYRELAEKHRISHSYITNENTDSTYGLVLTADHAIDKEDIHLPEETPTDTAIDKTDKKPWWRRLLGI